MEERVWTACWQFQPKVLNIHLEFSPTWSCVSLTWSTASSEWKLFRFDKIEVNYFQILLVDVTFIVSVATGDFIIILNVLGQWWTTMFHFLSSSQTLLPSLVHCLFAPDRTLTMINSALSHDPRSRLLLDTPPLCTNVRLMAWDSFSRPRSSLTHCAPVPWYAVSAPVIYPLTYTHPSISPASDPDKIQSVRWEWLSVIISVY